MSTRKVFLWCGFCSTNVNYLALVGRSNVGLLLFSSCRNLIYWMQTTSVLLCTAMTTLRKKLQVLLTQFVTKCDQNNDESISPEEVGSCYILLCFDMRISKQKLLLLRTGTPLSRLVPEFFRCFYCPIPRPTRIAR